MKNRTQHQFIRSLDRFSVGPLPLSYIDYVPNLFLVYDLDLIHNQHPFSASSCLLARVGASTSRRHLRTGGRSSWREVGEQRYAGLTEADWWSRSLLDLTKSFTWSDRMCWLVLRSPFVNRRCNLFFTVEAAQCCEFLRGGGDENECK